MRMFRAVAGGTDAESSPALLEDQGRRAQGWLRPGAGWHGIQTGAADILAEPFHEVLPDGVLLVVVPVHENERRTAFQAMLRHCHILEI